MSEFHFIRPGWLFALLPLVGLLWLMYRSRQRGGDWSDYCDAELLPYILSGSASTRSSRPLGLAALTGLLAIVALAGPTWQRLPAPVFRNLSALVIVLDQSWAMEAADLKPNRLERARYKIDDILRARKDGQTALIVYAGDAFVVTPLTDDVATIASQLTAISPRIMPIAGTRMDKGLQKAAQLLRQAGQKSGDILLLTTGAGVDDAMKEARHLHSEGFRISALGVGTRDGAPVPLSEGGFQKDSQGGMIISRLDVQSLWNLTQAGGGLYHSLDSGSTDVDAVLRFIDRRTETGQQQAGADVHVEQWKEAGVWILPLLLPLAALAFRRGWLAIVLAAVLMPVPEEASALEWRDLWLTPDQQAQQALEAGDARQAAERFRDPDWKAAAEYRAGAFEQAAKSLENRDTAFGRYNQGNALARQGQLEQALKAYDRSLEIRPGDEDTLYNRKLVEEALRKKQDEQKQEDQQKDGKDPQQQKPQNKDKDREGKNPPSKPPSGKDEPSGQDPQDRNNPQQPPSDSGQNQGGPQDAPSDQSPPKEPPSRDDNARQAEPPPSDKPGEPPSEPPQQQAPESKPKGGTPPPPPGDPASKPEADQAKPAATEPGKPDENQQNEAQWLRRVPDDPGGLLKRKFYLQYRQRQQQGIPE